MSRKHSSAPPSALSDQSHGSTTHYVMSLTPTVPTAESDAQYDAELAVVRARVHRLAEQRKADNARTEKRFDRLEERQKADRDEHWKDREADRAEMRERFERVEKQREADRAAQRKDREADRAAREADRAAFRKFDDKIERALDDLKFNTICAFTVTAVVIMTMLAFTVPAVIHFLRLP